jgi:hypothetical protein
MNVSLLLIATNRYNQFVQPLLDGVEKYFVPGHKITVHLFTDEIDEIYDYVSSDRVTVEQHLIPSYKFPEATLFRYKIFTEHAHLIRGDYAFYMDVDMEIVDTVGDEILQGDIVAVRHPGFFMSDGWGSPNNNPESLSHIDVEHRKRYFAGGFQGGKTIWYLTMAKILADNIESDKNKGIIAEWHDETHFNFFCNYMMGRDCPDWRLNELTPSYCAVPIDKRKDYKLEHLPAKIVALDKDHTKIRS